MKKSLFVEFQQHSQDFLRLLGEKARQSDRSKSAAAELSTLELFWHHVEEIFKKYEHELHSNRLLLAIAHAKGIIAQGELKSTYNELYKIQNKLPVELAARIARIIAKSSIPKNIELDQEVHIKNNPG